MRLHKLRILNFKAFKTEEVIDLEGKNALICGNNGSGKSSFHFALHVFLQSSLKNGAHMKYFADPKAKGGEESLLNIYGDPKDYLLELELEKQDNSKQKYQIKPTLDAGALAQSHQDIINADFASDFISHRLLVNFYNFRNSQDANLWTLFENEVFPYWNDDKKGKSFDAWLKDLRKEAYELSQQTESVPDESGTKTITRRKFTRESDEFKKLQANISEFNKNIFDFYSKLLPGVNTILNDFLPGEKIEVNIAYQSALDIDGNYHWNFPQLIIQLKANGISISKPHTFLNEARLTALALSIRLAMFNQKFKGTAPGDTLKLLVLDDLLVSLDMSFRMKLVNYIQKEQGTGGSFEGYQILLLTHDKGLFEILKNTLAADERKWKAFEFFENSSFPINDPKEYKNPVVVEKDDCMQVAKDYLFGRDDGKKKITKDYEISALYLRKKTEQIIKRFYDPEMEQIFRYRVLEDLSSSISHSHKEYINSIYADLERVLSQSSIDEAKIDKLIQLDFSTTGLAPAAIQENNKLKTFKGQVLGIVKQCYLHTATFRKQKKDLEDLSDELNKLRSRIMNKGAHHDDSPIYELELRGAIDKITEYETKVLQLKKK